jgi:hypothetical protein
MALQEAAGKALLTREMQRKKPEQGKWRAGEQGAGMRGQHGEATDGPSSEEQRAAGDVARNLAWAAAGACEHMATGARAQSSREKQARILGMPERRAHSWSDAGMHACGRPK